MQVFYVGQKIFWPILRRDHNPHYRTSDEGKLLNIECQKPGSLNSTNVKIPDALFRKYNPYSVHITFLAVGISQLTKPLISTQLENLVTSFTVSGDTITKIEARVFDQLWKLKALHLTNAGLNDTLVNSGFVRVNYLE